MTHNMPHPITFSLHIRPSHGDGGKPPVLFEVHPVNQSCSFINKQKPGKKTGQHHGLTVFTFYQGKCCVTQESHGFLHFSLGIKDESWGPIFVRWCHQILNPTSKKCRVGLQLSGLSLIRIFLERYKRQ